jgi:hypothetical protein
MVGGIQVTANSLLIHLGQSKGDLGHGLGTATFYKWRAKFGEMDASLMVRIKELEDENKSLK